MIRSLLTSLLAGVLLVWLILLGPICWILRDGLGPNAVDSEGWQQLLGS
jgi:hypothetical protein